MTIVVHRYSKCNYPAKLLRKNVTQLGLICGQVEEPSSCSFFFVINVSVEKFHENSRFLIESQNQYIP